MNTDHFFESAEQSDVGKKRKNNEDACIRIPDRGVFCVADGMGGQAGGDLASEAIVTTLQEVFAKNRAGENETLAQRIALFDQGVNQANKWIKNFSEEKVIGQMGSTVVGLVVDPRNPARGMGLHAGDSRLYRYRGGALKQLTEDHSAINALAAKLGIDPSAVPAKYQNELVRCVGMTETVELERTPVEISSGDVYLICSDGLTKMVSDEGIAKLIKGAAAGPVAAMAKVLIDAANEAGGRDNVSVVLVRVGDISAAPKAEDIHEEEGSTLDSPTASPPAVVPEPEHPHRDLAGAHDTADTLHGETPRTSDPSSQDETRVTDETRAEPPPPAPKAAPEKSGGGKNRKIGIIAVVIVAAGVGSWFVASRKTSPAVPVAPPPMAETQAPVIQAPVHTVATTEPVAPPKPVSTPTIVSPPQPVVEPPVKNPLAAVIEVPQTPAPKPVVVDNHEKEQAEMAAAAAKAAEAEKQRVEEAFHTAIRNAQAALDVHDINGAEKWCAEALRAMPGDATAIRLLEDARKVAVAEALDARYRAALQEGRAAVDRKDYAAAAQKAAEALALRPNDADATQLADQVREPADLAAAGAAFERGDYTAVASLAKAHPGADAFASLKAGSVAEQQALAEATQSYDSGDYAFTVKLKRQPYAKKPPFLDLIGKASAEWNKVDELRSLLQANEWRGVLEKLNDPAAAAWSGKPPFLALAGHAAQQRDLAGLNSTLQTMLVQFGVGSAADQDIQDAAARQAKPIDGPLSPDQKGKYSAMVDKLEDGYRQGGWLDDDDRARTIAKLRDAIARHP